MSKQDLIITHLFDASVENVWRAWHEEELVTQWWGPDGFTCPQVRMDFREGGVSLLCMRAPDRLGGYDSYSTWTYTAIEPHKRIELIHNLADEKGNRVEPASVGMPADFPQDMRQEILFRSEPDRCQVTVIEYGWPVGQMMEFSRMGMEQCLRKMAAALR